MKEKPQTEQSDTQQDADENPSGSLFEGAAMTTLATGELSTGALVCDSRDLMLELLRHRPKPWSAMSEDEQSDVANVVENFCETLVQSIVTLVASKGLPVLTATQEKFDYKGGAARITLKAVGGPELAQELAEFDSKQVLLVSADASEFYGMRPAATMPDAPELFDEAEPDEPVDLEEAAEASAQELEATTAV